MPARDIAKNQSRRASSSQAAAMKKILSGLMPDIDGTSALKAGCEDGEEQNLFLYGDLPDEEKEYVRKVDFSVLAHELPTVEIYPDDAVGRMEAACTAAYAISLGKALKACYREYLLVAEQLANAQELILNGQNTLFGRSSQRFSALMGKQEKSMEAEDVQDGTEAEAAAESQPEIPAGEEPEEKTEETGKEKTGKKEGSTQQPPEKHPRRQKGCADKVCQDAEENIIHVYMDKQKLDSIFGEGNWKEIAMESNVVKFYRVIPARVIVDKYILHQYRVIDPDLCPGAPEMCGARSPFERLRPKSRVSASLMAYLMYFRNSLRMPVDRICSHVAAIGLNLTSQQVYENLNYYDQFFTKLQERQWIKLLNCHYLQIDETPVRYYDRKEKKVKRGYLWVFTASEMLENEEKITLFHFAQGRGADVLRECLSGFTGVIGSDGHSAYQVFARESQGAVINAGCLEHFRKRVVAALRVIPGLDRMTEEEKRKIPAYVILTRLNKVFELERKVKLLQSKAEREAFREDQVREAFEAVVAETLGLKDAGQPPGSYLASAIRYMENQEVCLEEFLKDGNIACHNSKSEQKIAFFAVLRNQIKMFGSFRGAQVASTLEGLEQTVRECEKNTRLYYQYLFDKLIPFIRKTIKEHPGETIDWGSIEELDQFMPWSEEYCKYRKALIEQEKNPLTASAVS